MDFDTQRRFDRALKRKQRRDPRAAAAVLEAMRRVLNDPENRGLNQHLLDRAERIWDVYVNDAARITFHETVTPSSSATTADMTSSTGGTGN